MMKYFRNYRWPYLLSVSTGGGMEEISEREFENIANIAKNIPTAPEGFEYRLRVDTLSWELVEQPEEPEPPEPELTDEEALAIILGGGEA